MIESRTAGALNHADLGREVTVTGETFALSSVSHAPDGTSLRDGRGLTVHCPADTPAHVHDEEAGRG